MIVDSVLDNDITKNSYSLEVICHADKLRWYASDIFTFRKFDHVHDISIQNWRRRFR